MNARQKAAIADRWYRYISSVPGTDYLLSFARKVIYSHIHHSSYEVQRETAYDALKELQKQDATIAAQAAEIARLTAALGKRRDIRVEVDDTGKYRLLIATPWMDKETAFAILSLSAQPQPAPETETQVLSRYAAERIELANKEKK